MVTNDGFKKFLSGLGVKAKGAWKEAAAVVSVATGAHAMLSKTPVVRDSYNSMMASVKENPVNATGPILIIISFGLFLIAALYFYYCVRVQHSTVLSRLELLMTMTPHLSPELTLVTADQWPVERGLDLLDEVETVRPRDKLVFRLTPKRAGYAYLLHINELSGRIKVIWPNKRDRNNDIRPREPLTVPQKGPDYIKVSSSDAGLETFFLVESSTRLEDAMPGDLRVLPNNLGELTDKQADALMGVLETQCRAADDRPGIAVKEVRSVAA
tara:strand:+ start:100 stop:909 length:810 start_codon:yes stop_codon:yes gene_type:complete